MPCAIELSKQARMFLLSLLDKRLRSRLEAEIDALKENPISAGAKKLRR